ncbi:uncharacterized protein LOC113365345 [Ctenocephalides felis]|uniref:uncharacterized protein LOC113365345 n=1 Tax=Ctenocephalides felis TaxID=7515 RepID=UPI000E6E4A30|nr:uncharacterized protein LOC113365345 [Ctenocephalides felis]
MFIKKNEEKINEQKITDNLHLREHCEILKNQLSELISQKSILEDTLKEQAPNYVEDPGAIINDNFLNDTVLSNNNFTLKPKEKTALREQALDYIEDPDDNFLNNTVVSKNDLTLKPNDQTIFKIENCNRNSLLCQGSKNCSGSDSVKDTTLVALSEMSNNDVENKTVIESCSKNVKNNQEIVEVKLKEKTTLEEQAPDCVEDSDDEIDNFLNETVVSRNVLTLKTNDQTICKIDGSKTCSGSNTITSINDTALVVLSETCDKGVEDKTVIESCSTNVNTQEIIDQKAQAINNTVCNSINICFSNDKNNEIHAANILQKAVISPIKKSKKGVCGDEDVSDNSLIEKKDSQSCLKINNVAKIDSNQNEVKSIECFSNDEIANKIMIANKSFVINEEISKTFQEIQNINKNESINHLKNTADYTIDNKYIIAQEIANRYYKNPELLHSTEISPTDNLILCHNNIATEEKTGQSNLMNTYNKCGDSENADGDTINLNNKISYLQSDFRNNIQHQLREVKSSLKEDKINNEQSKKMSFENSILLMNEPILKDLNHIPSRIRSCIKSYIDESNDNKNVKYRSDLIHLCTLSETIGALHKKHYIVDKIQEKTKLLLSDCEVLINNIRHNFMEMKHMLSEYNFDLIRQDSQFLYELIYAIHHKDVLKKVRAPYISLDSKENEDNDNPNWSVLKALETDEERYKAVRKRWLNLNVPDPHINMTYRTRRFPFLNLNNFKNEFIPTKNRTVSFEVLFDAKINKLHEQNNKSLQDLNQEEIRELDELSSRHYKEQQDSLFSYYKYEQDFRLMYQKQMEETRFAKEKFGQQRRMILTEKNFKLRLLESEKKMRNRS